MREFSHWNPSLEPVIEVDDVPLVVKLEEEQGFGKWGVFTTCSLLSSTVHTGIFVILKVKIQNAKIEISSMNSMVAVRVSNKCH